MILPCLWVHWFVHHPIRSRWKHDCLLQKFLQQFFKQWTICNPPYTAWLGCLSCRLHTEVNCLSMTHWLLCLIPNSTMYRMSHSVSHTHAHVYSLVRHCNDWWVPEDDGIWVMLDNVLQCVQICGIAFFLTNEIIIVCQLDPFRSSRQWGVRTAQHQVCTQTNVEHVFHATAFIKARDDRAFVVVNN